MEWEFRQACRYDPATGPAGNDENAPGWVDSPNNSRNHLAKLVTYPATH
jgi:hypothetical protein